MAAWSWHSHWCGWRCHRWPPPPSPCSSNGAGPCTLCPESASLWVTADHQWRPVPRTMQLGCLCKNVIFQLFLIVNVYWKLIWTHHMCQQFFSQQKQKNLTQKPPLCILCNQQRHLGTFWQFCQSARCKMYLHCLFTFSLVRILNMVSKNVFAWMHYTSTYISTEQISMRPELIGSVVQQTWGEGQVSSNGSEFESSYYSWK